MVKVQDTDINPRREFIKKTALGVVTLPFSGPISNSLWAAGPAALDVHIFSKHLQFLEWAQAAEKAAELGFAGIDLTVRPGGHVTPEKVAGQLPRAIDTIEKGGSSCSLITTAVESMQNGRDRAVLETASGVGIQLYRTNWYRYRDTNGMQDSLKYYQQEIKQLSRTNKKLGLVGCYQNHAGELIGSSLWEVKHLLEDVPTAYFGVQYDIRHATVEGGLSWPNGLKLIREHIKSIVLKDFKWEKVSGRWQITNTPIGEGQVDFLKFFRLIKLYAIQVPAILHMEYPLGGAEHGHSEITIEPALVYDAMRKDLKTIRKLWQTA